MRLIADALVLAMLPHGEHGAVLRLLTAEYGLQSGYVRGGRSRRLRPILQAGNTVQVELRSRTDSQLAAATVELVQSRTHVTFDPLGAAGLAWVTAATAHVLPEADVHPALHHALLALLDTDIADHSKWVAALVRYELLLLAELGFGLDLTSCAATGVTTDLIYVSPKSSQAVSAAAGAPFASRLLPLPGFIRDPARQPEPAELVDGVRLAGWFLGRHLFADSKGQAVLAARDRFVALATRG